MPKPKSSNKATVSNVSRSPLSKFKGLPKSAKISIFFVAVLLVAVGVTLGYNKYSAAGSGNKSLALKAKALGPSDFTTVFDNGGFAARGCVVQQSNGTRGVIMTYAKAVIPVFGGAPDVQAVLQLLNSNGTPVGGNGSTTWWNNSVTALKLHSYSPGDQAHVVITSSSNNAGGGGTINIDNLRNCDSSLNSTSF